MTEFEDDLAAAGDALLALADGPGVAAAEALEGAFGQAGARIEAVLGQAARAGELDFQRMADAILRDLARVAAEAAVSYAALGSGPAGQTVNFNMSFAPGADARDALQSRGAVATALASAVAAGGRFL